MPALKNKIAFLKNACDSVGVYGMLGTLRLVLYEAIYASKFGFDASQMVEGDGLAVDEEILKHGRPHLPSPYYFAQKAFKRIPGGAENKVFIEMGCGLGRVMLFASQFPFKKLIGVEISEPLTQAARSTLENHYRKTGKRAPEWDIVKSDVRDFSIPNDGTVFYFGDPFDETIMQTVIDNILDSVEQSDRQVIILYVHPVHKAVLTEKGFRVLDSAINESCRGYAVLAKGGKQKTTNEAWDDYWRAGSHQGKGLYDLIAAFYRRVIIRPAVNFFLGRNFAPGADILHAGCGSGMVDVDAAKRTKITALDISEAGLAEYARHHDDNVSLLHGSILDIPAENETFDGIFNLGVMEHFTKDELCRVLPEFNRVLKPGGRIVLFWPPEWGLSVNVLRAFHFFIHKILKSDFELHPPEHTRVRSKRETDGWLKNAGFEMRTFYFGPRDFFTHQIVVAEKVRQITDA